MNMQNGAAQHVRAGMPQAVGNWRVELTRDQRQELIAKIYHELIRVTGERPGTAVWMKASLYELKLFQESAERKEYINKIARRLYLLKLRPNAAPAPVNTAMSHPKFGQDSLGVSMGMHNQQTSHAMSFDIQYGQSQQLSQQSMQSHLQNNGTSDPMKASAQSGGVNANAAQLAQQQQRAMHRAQQLAQQQDSGSPLQHKSPHANSTPMNTGQYGIMPQSGNSNDLKLYMDKLQVLKNKYWEHVMVVFRAFHKYVAHLGAQDDSEQKKKLKYLLAYVNHVVTILSEDPTQKDKLDPAELDKVERYIQRIVIPYLSKLNQEKTKTGGMTPVGDSLFSQQSADHVTSLSHSQPLTSSSMTPTAQIGGMTSYSSYASSGADLSFGQNSDLNFGTPTNSMSYMSSGYNMQGHGSLGMSSGNLNPGGSYSTSNSMGLSGAMPQTPAQQGASSAASSQQQTSTVQSTVTTTSEQADRNGNNSGSSTPAQQLMTLVETL